MKTALTPSDIEGAIKEENYLKVGHKTTICQLILQNNFEVIGVSACVDAANFDFEIGKRIARGRAEEKVWELEGYRLQCALHEGVQSLESVD